MIQTQEDNTFTRRSEFIDRDHRKNRPTDIGTAGKPYTVTTDFMFNRHRVMLPRELVEGKTILDIGSCYGATGAWCLDNGAKHYAGLEPQHKFAIDSADMMSANFPLESFNIVEHSLEEFNSYKKFDIVVASGVIHGFFDPYKCVELLVKYANEVVIIDSQHPYGGYRNLYPNATVEQRKYAANVMNMIQIVREKPAMVDADSEASVVYSGCFPSYLSLKAMFANHGWTAHGDYFDYASAEIPEHYDLELGRRFMAKFTPGTENKVVAFAEAIKDPNKEKVSWHSGNLTNE